MGLWGLRKQDYMCLYNIRMHIYIYIYGHPPHDRPRPSKHRSHRRVRAFSGVSSLSPPNVSVKNHPTTETKKPKNQSSTENAGTVLVFWFFGSLVFCFFFLVFLVPLVFCVFWFFGCLVLLWRGLYFKKTQKTKKQRTKQPKNQTTKKPKEPKNQKTKKPKNQNCSSILRGALVFWLFGFGRRVVLRGHVRRVQTRYPGKSRLILILILG